MLQVSRKKGYFSALLLALIIYVLLAAPGLFKPGLEGLDGAHHVMDGVFFYDFFRDFFTHFPHIQPIDYLYDYYRQYPALGFLFWPPLFPLFEGSIMLIFGPNLQATWIALTLSGMLLVYSLFQITKRNLSPLESFLLICCFLSFPILKNHIQLVMLEIPLLAMMSFSIYKYIQITEQTQISQRNLILLAVVGALSLYIKQTAMIAYIALLIDFMIFHRQKTQGKHLLIAAALFCFIALPLIIFTLTIGRINLEQSFGHGTQKVMANYISSERWSLNNWLYYIKAMPQNLSVIWVFPILITFVASVKNKNPD